MFMFMFMFNDELRALAASVRSGRSAHIVGPGGVGVSTVLRALTVQLESEGYAVVALTDTPYTRAVDFYPLQHAFPAPSARTEPRSFATLIDAVTSDLAATPLRAIVLDGIENIDRGTLAVAQASADRISAPIVYSRSVSIDTLLRADIHYSRNPGRRINLHPLDFAGTAALVQDRLGYQPDTEIVSRVFAKSGGLTGLALAIVDGAVDNGLIELRGGRWMVTGRNLWSSSIEGWLETRLSPLNAAAFDALEHLARSHATAQTAGCSHLDQSTISELHGRGLLSASSDGTAVSLTPPALVDYFCRCEELGTQRSDSGTAVAGPTSGELDIARRVRVFRESTDEKLSAYAHTWESTRTVTAALPYVQTLMDVPRGDRALETVFTDTPLASARTPSEAFDFAYSRARWSRQSESPWTTPLTPFTELGQLFPVWEPALAIVNQMVVTGAASIGDDPMSVFSQIGIVGTPGEALCIAAFAYVNLTEGKPGVAGEWAALVPPSDIALVHRVVGFVEALAGLTSPTTGSALPRSLDALTRAYAERDHSAILLHAYAATLSLLELARLPEALAVIDSALAFGPSGAANNGLYRALLWMGAFINLWSGQSVLASFLHAEAESLPVMDDALPGMQKDLGAVVRLLILDDPTAAMVTLRSLVERLSQQQNLFAALMTAKLGLAVWPEPRTLTVFNALRMRAWGRQPCRVVELIDASFTDPTRLLALARA